MSRRNYLILGSTLTVLFVIGFILVNSFLIKKTNPVDYIKDVINDLSGKKKAPFISTFSDEHQNYEVSLNSEYRQELISEAFDLPPTAKVNLVVSDVPQQITVLETENGESLVTNSFSVVSDSRYQGDEVTIFIHVDNQVMNQWGKSIQDVESYLKVSLFYALAEWQLRKDAIATTQQLKEPQERMSGSFKEGIRVFQYLSALENKPLFFIREANQ